MILPNRKQYQSIAIANDGQMVRPELREFSYVDGQGRILIPREVRTAARFASGARVEILLIDGAVAIRPLDAIVAEAVADLKRSGSHDGT